MGEPNLGDASRRDRGLSCTVGDSALEVDRMTCLDLVDQSFMHGIFLGAIWVAILNLGLWIILK